MRKVELLPTRDCEAGYGPVKTCLVIVTIIKRALDKYNIILQLSPKRVEIFYIIRSVGVRNDCMLNFTF